MSDINNKLNDQDLENISGGTITEEEAIAAALEHAKLSKSQVSSMKGPKLDFENGVQVYEIEFLHNGIEYEFDIDANNGKILKFKKDRD